MATSRRYPIGCALGLVLGGLACQALAEPPAATQSNDNGLMTFKHARVINAPPAATEQQPAADAASVKAFVDPLSGDLTAGTPEQNRQLSDAVAARTRLGVLSNGTATNTSTDDSERVFYGRNNIVGLMLTDADMISQTVHIDADGNLVQECVTGEDAAAHAAHEHAQQGRTQQENRNDR